MSTPDRYAELDAAYVLGALTPAERRDFEAHKAHCLRCAASVAELAGLPGILSRVSRADAERGVDADAAEPVPSAVLTSLLAGARRRRLRRRLASASLAAAAAVALTVGVTASSRSSQASAAVPLTQLVDSPVHADVRFAAEPWGTRIDIRCTYQPGAAKPEPSGAGHGYVLFVTDRLGHRILAGSWRAGTGTTVSPTGSVAVSLADIAKVQISSSAGTPLLELNR